MARKKKLKVFRASKAVKAAAREQIGSPQPTRIVPTSNVFWNRISELWGARGNGNIHSCLSRDNRTGTGVAGIAVSIGRKTNVGAARQAGSGN
jgi:hypothetical protein